MEMLEIVVGVLIVLLIMVFSVNEFIQLHKHFRKDMYKTEFEKQLTEIYMKHTLYSENTIIGEFNESSRNVLSCKWDCWTKEEKTAIDNTFREETQAITELLDALASGVSSEQEEMLKMFKILTVKLDMIYENYLVENAPKFTVYEEERNAE